MSKSAVQIDLVYVDDRTDEMRIHAVLSDGKLASAEMYCHLHETSLEGKRGFEYGRLCDEDGTFTKYVGEWNQGDKTLVTFEFLNRPLAVGQRVLRVDVAENDHVQYSYEITAITDLLT